MKDAEQIFDDCFQFFKTNLNTTISAINAEKGDSILGLFDADSWIQGGPDTKVANFEQFCLAYIQNIDGQVNGPFVTWKITFEVDAVIAKHDVGDQDYKRVLRLQRALKEVSEKSWKELFVGLDRPAVKVLSPIDVQLFNDAQYQKVVGVQIEIEIS